MRVWIVNDHWFDELDFENTTIIGVFSSHEKAIEAIEKLAPESKPSTLLGVYHKHRTEYETDEDGYEWNRIHHTYHVDIEGVEVQ